MSNVAIVLMYSHHVEAAPLNPIYFANAISSAESSSLDLFGTNYAERYTMSHSSGLGQYNMHIYTNPDLEDPNFLPVHLSQDSFENTIKYILTHQDTMENVIEDDDKIPESMQQVFAKYGFEASLYRREFFTSVWGQYPGNQAYLFLVSYKG